MKVARIISDTELAITLDESSNIEVGDKLQIMDLESDPIIDPDTNEVIGGIPIPKDTVKVTKVFEKFCIAEKQNKATVGSHSNAFNLMVKGYRPLMVSSISEINGKSLNIDRNQIKPKKYNSTSDLPIQIGDYVQLKN
ncbi:hypothetical protein [Pediococcus pentosaceus]|uniref:Uncharacterized protein n=1 Tax=Pediococcus pentosaceus TaxID=1255 RepID=A0AA40X8H9_PEDPE|nr:hypothetical protein [Pediococcus pentosaceus]MBF7126627.1 hypothetical protein [Pediococcus pentosaceus]